jgi:hypothetical protein
MEGISSLRILRRLLSPVFPVESRGMRYRHRLRLLRSRQVTSPHRCLGDLSVRVAQLAALESWSSFRIVGGVVHRSTL